MGAFLCAALVAAPPVQAAPPLDPTDLRRRFEAAQHDYDLRRFAEAKEGFAAAYEASPNPAFLFNLAQCERQLGQLDQAAFFYRRYLSEAPDGPAAENARTLLGEVTAKQDALERETAERTRAEENARRALQAVNVRKAPEPAPFYRTWWFIAGAGVLVGGAVGVGAWALASRNTTPRQPTLGEVQAR